MCGIAGFQGRSPVDVAAMTSAIAHRGPDADGHMHLVREGAGIHTQLGHRRLSIIDLSAQSNQPMTNACAKCGTRSTAAKSQRDWIVFNGEIYNYRELRVQLSQQGHTFETASDTEVLLHLFDEYGLDMFSRLNGIFAFGVYAGAKDRPALGLKQGDLVLARDHLGVKPLYYAEAPGGVYFASEVKALTAAGLRFEPNLDVLRQFMIFLYGMAPDTPYQGVSKLEPGEVAVIRDGRLARKSSFYRLPFSGTYTSLSYRDAVAETERQVSAAVTRQMVSDVPVGAFLSGGVDSSLVVTKAMAEAGGRGIDCFTILDSTRLEGALDDNHFAHQFAKKRGVRLHDVPVQPSSLDLLEKVIYHMDEPHADVAAINSYLICQTASRQGTKVLLSGIGGDDVFSGYPRHRAAYIERMRRRAPRLAAQLTSMVARVVKTDEDTAVDGPTFLRKVRRALSASSLSESERLVEYYMSAHAQGVESLLGERFRSHPRQDERTRFALPLKEFGEELDPLDAMLLLELRHFLGDHNLNYADKMSMAHGVEVRVPLIDRELVEFAATMPPAYKMRRFRPKALLKDAAAGCLPPEIISRKKHGFGVRLDAWFADRIAGLRQTTLSRKSIEAAGYFAFDKVDDLARRVGQGNDVNARLLFAVLSIQIWNSVCIERHRPAI